MLFERYVSVAELNGVVLNFEVRYKNLVDAKDLTSIAFTFWQIMLTNVLPQGGHLE